MQAPHTPEQVNAITEQVKEDLGPEATPQEVMEEVTKRLNADVQKGNE